MIEKSKEFVKKMLDNEPTGHDYWHAIRVYNMAKRLAREIEEDVNIRVIELAALLHDVADHKFEDYEVRKEKMMVFIDSLDIAEEEKKEIIHIIENMSFSKSLIKRVELSLEGQIVQDADRLDSIGAIGIARAFAYGGKKGRSIYNPEIKPNVNLSYEKYRKSVGPTINHFYEKLLLLKDKMNTEPARRIAEHRHKFMEEFLEEFYREWEGKK